MPVREELPDTIKRSPKQAQRTWIKAHDAAVKTYGEGRRAHQTAFAALKHSFGCPPWVPSSFFVGLGGGLPPPPPPPTTRRARQR